MLRSRYLQQTNLLVLCTIIGLMPVSGWSKATAKVIAADELAVKNTQTDVDKAKKDYAAAQTAMRADFEHSSDLKDAQLAVTKAVADVTAAREVVIAKLGSKPEYRAAAKKAADAQAAVDALKKGNAAREDISAASANALKAGSDVSAMERTALADDADWNAASKKLTDLTDAQAKLKSDFEKTMTTDPNLVKLKKSIDDLTVKLTKAKNKLDVDSKP